VPEMADSILKFQEERTLVLIKPDGVQRSLMGEIIRRIERTPTTSCALELKDIFTFYKSDFDTINVAKAANTATIIIIAPKSVGAKANELAAKLNQMTTMAISFFINAPYRH
jgi:hypothetical protein